MTRSMTNTLCMTLDMDLTKMKMCRNLLASYYGHGITTMSGQMIMTRQMERVNTNTNLSHTIGSMAKVAMKSKKIGMAMKMGMTMMNTSMVYATMRPTKTIKISSCGPPGL